MSEVKKDLAFIWNEAEELSCSLRELTDDELIDCRSALLDRVKAIMMLTEGAVE
jgi:hypothetical protein